MTFGGPKRFAIQSTEKSDAESKGAARTVKRRIQSEAGGRWFGGRVRE